MRLDYPSATSSFVAYTMQQTTSATAWSNARSFTNNASLTSTGVLATGTPEYMRIRGTITPTAAGKYYFLYGSEVAASASALLKGSSCELEAVN